MAGLRPAINMIPEASFQRAQRAEEEKGFGGGFGIFRNFFLVAGRTPATSSANHDEHIKMTGGWGFKKIDYHTTFLFTIPLCPGIKKVVNTI